MSARLHIVPRSAADALAPAQRSIRVVLADNHAAMRRTLRAVLESEGDIEVIAEAADLASVARHVHAEPPPVLVLDFGLRDGSSIDAIRRLRQEAPATQIIVVTMDDSPGFAQRALSAGAVGFVLKDTADAELAEAVCSAARGEEYTSPRLAGRLALLRRPVAGNGLSGRETEVLRLIALGHTSAEIAGTLHVSRRTIETDRAHIHRKLGLMTRAELVSYAIRRGLVVT